jgi:hypothetical protein
VPSSAGLFIGRSFAVGIQVASGVENTQFRQTPNTSMN